MTIEARYNLQKGVPENKIYDGTNYTSNGSAVDNYILGRERIKKMINAREDETKARKLLEKQVKEQVEKQVCPTIERTLKNALNNF